MSLVLHCGADAITRDQLAAMPMPMPMGPTHAVRPFIEDVELVSDYLGEHGMRVVEEAYGVKTRDVHGTPVPTQFFGLMELVGEGSFAVMVGLRGSYDQSLPRGIAVGSRVFVCDNLAFSGEVDVHTRQTTGIDRRMPNLIAAACSHIPKMAEEQDERFHRYMHRAISPGLGDAILVELYRAGAVGARALTKAIEEWGAPSRPEFVGEMNLWGVHNAITEALKGDGQRATVLSTWEKTIKLTRVLDRHL